jgi:chaperonin cofactor prefoldin
MTNTKRWVDVLRQHYTLVSNSEGGRDLLLAVRKFVAFLDTDPHARRYIKELDYKWDVANKERRNDYRNMRAQLSELEQKIRAVGAELYEATKDLQEIPDAARRTMHILGKIRENDWYQSGANMRDDLDLEQLHVERPPQTRTGHMVSKVVTLTGVLAKFAEAVGVKQETIAELKRQAEGLWRQYESARRKLQHDWISSGKYALEQLRTVVRIIDGDLFVDPADYKLPSLISLAPWKTLISAYAPSDLRQEITRSLKHIETEHKDFKQDLEPLIRSYLRLIFEELQFLATSRLAHQHLVERYKVRCENYDWKHIAELIKSHAKLVEEEVKSRYEFEDLLTLHFARYLHDNGYAVHYTPRDGVHEPDLLGNLRNDLEPIVVEAKVVGQQYGTTQGKSWIFKGLRALLAYLQKYYSDYGITDGYLIVFRVGDEKFPMYMFDRAEWEIGQFTIVPKVINIGKINKTDEPVLIKREDFMEDLGSNLN